MADTDTSFAETRMAQDEGDIDLWFSCGSTYTYLTIARLEAIEAEHDIRLRLRPFYLSTILDTLHTWPFPEGSPRTAYMWRDIERRARARGLNPTLPAPYPAQDARLANAIAWLGLQQNWGRMFLRESYKAWFEGGASPGSPENYGPVLRGLGRGPDEVLRIIERAGVHESLVAETTRARSAGVFGSPTFEVNGEIFWGDDRIEDAVAWFRSGPSGG